MEIAGHATLGYPLHNMSTLRAQRLSLVVAGCLIAGWPASAWAFKARINRPIVHEVIKPGQTTNGTIEVNNDGEEPLVLDIYLQDWEYVDGGSGDKLFSPPGSSSWSASSWISFFPQRLELPSHGKGLIEYTIRVPPQATGMHCAVLFFESLLARGSADKNGVTVQYTGRLGSLFELDAAGTLQRVGAVRDVTVGRPDEDRPLTLGYTFLNTGNVAIRPKAYFNIVDAAGRYRGRGEFKQLYTFPGRSGTATTEWTGGLPPGLYTVLLTLDLGEHEVLVSERPFTAKRELTIDSVVLQGGGSLRAQVTVHNTGNFQADVQGTLTLENNSSTPTGSWPLKTVRLSPDAHGTLSLSVPAPVPAGDYHCHVALTATDVQAERTVPCRVD